MCKYQVVRFFQIIIVRSRRNQSDRRINRASSDAGPELAGRDGIVAMESPQALMCPLEKGVRGIETGHQMPGRRIMKRWSCTARSPREDQALLLRRHLPLVRGR